MRVGTIPLEDAIRMIRTKTLQANGTDRLDGQRVNLLRSSSEADRAGNRNHKGRVQAVVSAQEAARLRICIADDPGRCL